MEASEMAKAPITKRTVDAAKPAAAEYIVWDDGGKETVKGFGLKVTPAGGKVYLYQYRLARPGAADQTPPRKYTIGKHGNLTPDQARIRAKELAAMVDHGIDPRQTELDALATKDEAKRQTEEKAKQEGELAFEKVASRWLEHYEIGHRPRSYGQAKLVIDKHLAPTLRGKPLPAITRNNIQAILDGIPARQLASRRTVYAYASIFFGWALQRGYVAESPLLSVEKPKAPKSRDHVLSDNELALVWQATEKLRAPLGAFYRVLMLTGQRREEVAGMTWAELDRASATWIIPADKAKNGVAHIVPLAPAVVEELDGVALAVRVKAKEDSPDGKRWPKVGPVMSIKGTIALSCFSQAKTALDIAVAKGAEAIKPWRVHDLRRTLATGLQRLGVRFEVTEAVLNHVSGARAGVAGIYQRHDWKDEKRAALSAWASHIERLISGAELGNVIALGVRA
jgi:integrase